MVELVVNTTWLADKVTGGVLVVVKSWSISAGDDCCLSSQPRNCNLDDIRYKLGLSCAKLSSSEAS